MATEIITSNNQQNIVSIAVQQQKENDANGTVADNAGDSTVSAGNTESPTNTPSNIPVEMDTSEGQGGERVEVPDEQKREIGSSPSITDNNRVTEQKEKNNCNGPEKEETEVEEEVNLESDEKMSEGMMSLNHVHLSESKLDD